MSLPLCGMLMCLDVIKKLTGDQPEASMIYLLVISLHTSMFDYWYMRATYHDGCLHGNSAHLTKTYDVTIQRYHKSHTSDWSQ